jgi:hypothetical protein
MGESTSSLSPASSEWTELSKVDSSDDSTKSPSIPTSKIQSPKERKIKPMKVLKTEESCPSSKIERERLIQEYTRFALAYKAECFKREYLEKKYNVPEVLVESLYKDMDTIYWYNWHLKKGKVASLNESIQELLHLVTSCYKEVPGDFGIAWLRKLEASSISVIPGERLGRLLGDAFLYSKDLIEQKKEPDVIEEEFSQKSKTEDQCRTIITFFELVRQSEFAHAIAV